MNPSLVIKLSLCVMMICIATQTIAINATELSSKGGLNQFSFDSAQSNSIETDQPFRGEQASRSRDAGSSTIDIFDVRQNKMSAFMFVFTIMSLILTVIGFIGKDEAQWLMRDLAGYIIALYVCIILSVVWFCFGQPVLPTNIFVFGMNLLILADVMITVVFLSNFLWHGIVRRSPGSRRELPTTDILPQDRETVEMQNPDHDHSE